MTGPTSGQWRTGTTGSFRKADRAHAGRKQADRGRSQRTATGTFRLASTGEWKAADSQSRWGRASRAKQGSGAKKTRRSQRRNRKTTGNRQVVAPSSASWKVALEDGSFLHRITGAADRWSVSASLVRFLAVTAAVLLLVGGGYEAYRFVTRSAHFEVHHVVFSPTEHVSAAELRSIAGIGTHANVFTLDLKKVASRVAAHPWIASAQATRKLPDTIEIHVTEQKPIVVVVMSGLYLANDRGVIFKRAKPEEVTNLPFVTGIDRSQYDRRRKGTEAWIREMIAIVENYDRRGDRPAVGELHRDRDGDVTLYTRKTGIQIRLGQGAIAAKLNRLDSVLTALGKDAARVGVVRLDNKVRPERVTVRLAQVDR
ncbi:MAG: FtsQ-type POTRA domain-containing protein [Deltaproteobacteria bacterium]|nr:FtsQ-type POTRA domain-containing protein [Deltaproteobacteria bacterium]